MYGRIVESLNKQKITFFELGGVKPNPRRSLVEEGMKIAQKENIDFLLACGGGSSIDTAKAIALGIANGGDYWQFYNGVEPSKMAPVGTIHTIAAAGSETSGSSVILDDIDNTGKHGFMYTACRPVFAIMNPELTYSVSKYQTGAGAADILSHTVNRYFIEEFSSLGDKYCVATMRNVIKYGPIAVNNPTNYEARSELMLTASFSHNDLTSIGRFSMRKGSEHGLETQLTAAYDTAHGAGLSVVMPAWLTYLVNNGEEKHVSRVAQFAVDVFDVDLDMQDIKGVALAGIEKLKNWLKSLGMPITLNELGVPSQDLEKIVERCECGPDGILPGFMDLDKNDVREIYKLAIK